MPPRPPFARIVLALCAVAGLMLAACSSSAPRDKRYGTDAALGWEPPEAAAVSSPDLGPDTAAGPVDSADNADGGTAVDAGTDEGT
jgi:pectin methylesterase-like acyl-CoA thioesterase